MRKQAVAVHKFGGSSLVDARHVRNIKSLLSGKDEIIIVSATLGTTSTLQALLDNAKNGLDYMADASALEARHMLIIKELNLKMDVISEAIKSDCLTINELLHAVQLTKSYSRDVQSLLLGFGELWSAKILHAYLAQDNNVQFLDASKVLVVFNKEGVVCVDWARSQKLLFEYLKGLEFNQLIITGFIASTKDGQKTILGRNGSDFSAAIFANLFSASSLTLWKDVDGMYTADPKLVRSALVIDELSYKEALELAYFGAKVIHPMSIAPLVEKSIPIYIRNSFNKQVKGTAIVSESKKSAQLIKGISSIENVALINIEGTGLISVSNIVSRVCYLLNNAKIAVILVVQASSQHSLCVAIPGAFLEQALSELSDNLETEIARKQIERIHGEKNCAVLSVVGDRMIGEVGTSAKLFGSLAKVGINIRAISQGSSERNIAVVINQADVKRAMQVVHAGFYLSRKTLSVGLIGPGVVGTALLRQIQQTLMQLSTNYQVNIYIRGIMDSKKMLLSHEPIDFEQWPDVFRNEAIEANLEQFVNHIADDSMPHAVIIDCTANQAIARCYGSFLERGIHVITPNKQANADELAYYKRLKSLSRVNTHYFYEATVCAGLPVITTLQDLIKTGDEIEEIEGVVSGTLSFIFNEMAKGRAFSEAVIEAKARGFTEPDPRQDLSGMDVARKLVCLAREIGWDISLEDVEVLDLVPDELANRTVEDFLAQLPNYDEKIQSLQVKAKANNERLHYVGSISAQGKVTVAIRSLPNSHPFSKLDGADNILLFRTKRYHDRPLVIQGPGAGAEVTAAGVFADLLRLVDVLS